MFGGVKNKEYYRRGKKIRQTDESRRCSHDTSLCQYFERLLIFGVMFESIENNMK